MKKYFIVLLAICAIITSCSKDADWSKDYLVDFMDVTTDAQGRSATAINDKDETFVITNPEYKLTPDSTYRYVLEYTKSDSKSITLYNAWPTICMNPDSLEEGGKIYKDPLTAQSIWQTNRYINATLKVPTSGMKHSMRFINLGISDNGNGQKIARVQLSHNMDKNTPSYTGTAYMSIPMEFYSKKLTIGTDSVYVILPTDIGELTYPFLYKYKGL